MFRKIRNFFRSVYYGIENMFIWIPVIWGDRQFDYSYIYTVLQKKLKLMEEHYSSGESFCSDSKKMAKQIKIARILCDRLVDSNYLDVLFKEVEDKYGDYFKLVKTKEEKDAYHKAFEHSRYLENQDKDYLFDFMKKKINNWWD